MARTAQWLTLGLTAVVFSTLAGCSSPTTSSTAENSSDPAAQQTAEATDTTKPEGESKTPFRPVDNVTLQPGSDPMAIVLATRQPSTEPIGSEQIKVNYPAPDKAVVTVTKTGLPDDSVAATRTRYEFAPADNSTDTKQWQLVQVTEQNKCQPNRGPQEWTGDLCQ
jgi:hypothetical protein